MPLPTDGWLDVTKPVRSEMVVWPGQPRTERYRLSSLDEGKSSNVSALTMSVHSGTHMDAPLHFLRDGPDITAAPFEAMFGPVRVAEIDGAMITPGGLEAYEARTETLKPGERLFCKTANSSREWLSEPFDEAYIAVDAEAAQIAHQLWHEEHPEEHGHNHGSIEPTDEHKKLAERRVRLGLLLADVGQKAEITVSDQEMTQAVMRQARNFPGQERAFFEFIQQNEAAQQQLRAPIFEDKVVDHIISGAKVTDRAVTMEELEKALETLDEV